MDVITIVVNDGGGGSDDIDVGCACWWVMGRAGRTA